MTNREMIRLEMRNAKTVPSQWLEDLNDEQRTRIELVYEEMVESGVSQNGIEHAMNYAYDREIIFSRVSDNTVRKTCAEEETVQ